MLDFIPTRARVFWNSELAYMIAKLKLAWGAKLSQLNSIVSNSSKHNFNINKQYEWTHVQTSDFPFITKLTNPKATR